MRPWPTCDDQRNFTFYMVARYILDGSFEPRFGVPFFTDNSGGGRSRQILTLYHEHKYLSPESRKDRCYKVQEPFYNSWYQRPRMSQHRMVKVMCPVAVLPKNLLAFPVSCAKLRCIAVPT